MLIGSWLIFCFVYLLLVHLYLIFLMKKILLALCWVFLLWVWLAVYVPVSQDAELMNDLETRIDALYMQDRNATIMIWNKIVNVLPKLSMHSRAYYILDGLYDYIAMKITMDNNQVTNDQMEDEMEDEMEDDMEDDIDVELNIAGEWLAFSMWEINVSLGDTVKVNFVSNGGYHDWVVDEFGASTTKVNEWDGIVSVTFVADQTGTFEYYCSVGQHRANGMVWSLIVQ